MQTRTREAFHCVRIVCDAIASIVTSFILSMWHDFRA